MFKTYKKEDSDNGFFLDDLITKIDFEILTNKLPPQHKKIIILKKNGYKLKEIAEMNQQKPSAIYYQYKKIKNKIVNFYEFLN